jgi:hypothetical protein
MFLRKHYFLNIFISTLITIMIVPVLVISGQPNLPFFMDDTVDFDQRFLNKWINDNPDISTDKELNDFLFSNLPEELFAEIFTGKTDIDNIQKTNGLFYYSGYKGGIWLNDIIENPDNEGIGPASMIRVFKLPALLALDSHFAKRKRVIKKSCIKKKRKALYKSLDRLIYLYGYNRGYLIKILENHPEGISLPPDYFSCKGLLDCDYPKENLEVFNSVFEIRSHLSDPPDLKWKEIAENIEIKLESSIQKGENVWTGIMENGKFTPDSYKSLVDISAQYLLINEAVMLLSAEALAKDDEELMDRALMADMALKSWLAGYMAGLGEPVKS